MRIKTYFGNGLMRTIFMIFLNFSLLLPIGSVGWGEVVYKSVDKNGRISFSDRPNDNKDEILDIRVSTRYSDNEASQSNAPDGDENEGMDENADEEVAQAEEAERKRLRDNNCKMAKENKKRNEEITRMYRMDKNGNRKYLSPEERQAVLNRSQKMVDQWCK